LKAAIATFSGGEMVEVDDEFELSSASSKVGLDERPEWITVLSKTGSKRKLPKT
jgi:hypothetical protein